MPTSEPVASLGCPFHHFARGHEPLPDSRSARSESHAALGRVTPSVYAKGHHQNGAPAPCPPTKPGTFAACLAPPGTSHTRENESSCRTADCRRAPARESQSYKLQMKSESSAMRKL